MVRHGKTGGSRQVWVGSIWLQVKWVTGQKRLILSGLKMGSCQSGCGLGQVDPYFSHDFFYKENNMYLPFEKLWKKNYLM